jgi:lipopolysaccharide/colanic/teichoic acid biosynthesis glycosyltransferase
MADIQESSLAHSALTRDWYSYRGKSDPFFTIQLSLKRAFDIALALIILTFVLPLLAFISLAIVIESGFPVFFLQQRPGRDSDVFTIFKFRTMRHAGEIKSQAVHNDSRVTRVGKFLRRSSLDELPQLINVLLGHMSLVGPRPLPLWLDEQFAERFESWRIRAGMRPGMTGLAQVNGARGEIIQDGDMERRFQLDLQYVGTWSLLLDVKILARTALVIWLDERAY